MTGEQLKIATLLSREITRTKDLIHIWTVGIPADFAFTLPEYGVTDYQVSALKTETLTRLGEKLASLEDEFRKL